MTQMTSQKEKLLERIKRCLMLGDSSKNNSPEEAANALNFAQRLMRDNNIHLSEVDFNNMKEEKGMEGEGVEKKKFKYWEGFLATVMAKFCSVGVFKKTYFDINICTYRQKMIFFGLEEDVIIAEQSYSILRKVILSMATNNGYKGTEAKSYCIGVVSTLKDRAEKEEEKEQQEMTPEDSSKCTAIMVIKNQVVEKYKKENLSLKDGKSRQQNISHSAYHQGRRDGHSVNMNPNRNTLE